MKQSLTVRSVQAVKVLGDPRRLTILRLLMRTPATLSQLGRELGDHPAKVRHHLKILEDAGFVELKSTRIVRGFVEKYYQATSNAYLVNLTIFPEPVGSGSLVMMGSHDLALEVLAGVVGADELSPDLFCVPVGSLDGLIGLRQGLCHIAGCHLAEGSGDEFNYSFVRHLFPGRSMTLIVLGYRQQGLIVQNGNPKRLSSLNDLAQGEIVMVNRQPGSGTRLWLDQQISDLGLDRSQIKGYNTEVKTHHQIGLSVSQGKADAGVGVYASAKRLGLEFIPFFEERFDLVLPTEEVDGSQFRPLFDRLNSAEFRERAAKLGGYDTRRTGEMVILQC
jgi:putative molybdopterin biosynthesis protein